MTLKIGDVHSSVFLGFKDRVRELQEGDCIEAWFRSKRGVERGFRSELVSSGGQGLRIRNIAGMYVRGYGGELNVDLSSFTVQDLAQREPAWAKAKAVIDHEGDVWMPDDHGLWSHRSITQRGSAYVEKNYGPCTVLLDEEGLIPTNTFTHMRAEGK